MSEPADRPMLRVVRGEPSAEELAALVAVLASRTATVEQPRSRRLHGWVDRAAALQRPVPIGPGAWVRSGLDKGARTRADF